MVLETLYQTQYFILSLLSCHFGRAATFGGSVTFGILRFRMLQVLPSPVSVFYFNLTPVGDVSTITTQALLLQ